MTRTLSWTTLALALLAAGSCKFIGRQVSELIRHLDRWDNGMPKREGDLVDGEQAGQWTYYYQDGKRRAQGPYQADRQFGEWTYWYENGNVEWRGEFDANGYRTGRWVFFYLDESKRAEGAYVADFEAGEWSFWDQNGRLERRGQFDGGKLSGPWTHWHPNGQKQAEGICYRGQRVGAWTLWTEAGAESVKDFGIKDGLRIVRETWPDGGLKRVGVLAGDEPVGRWVSYHPGGALRFACSFEDGRATGRFEANRPDGTALAAGAFEGGEFAEGCEGFDPAGLAQEIVAGPMPRRPPGGSGEWLSAEDFASIAPDAAVAALLEEARAPVTAAALEAAEPAPDAVAAAPEQVAAIEAEPERVPASKQPDWTVRQQSEMKEYVLDYLDGSSSSKSSRAGRYGVGKSGSKTSGPRRRSELEGKPLPVTRFESVDGTVVDTKELEGKKDVLIVVLRGFAGEVCVYCVAQTEALAQSRDKFAELDIEVLVVYPGPKGNEKAFLDAYEETFGKGAPPYKVFYDPDLSLVSKLGIQGGDLAFPTTLIVDKQGLVQYAYVGEHRADRPAAKKLLEAIEGMAK